MESNWEDQNNWVKEISFETIEKKKSRGFLGGSVVKKLPANAGDVGLIPGSGRSSGEGNGNPLHVPGKSHGQRSLAVYSPWDHKRVGHD